jgi:DNA primase
MANQEVAGWFRAKYGISDEMIERLKIGFADESDPTTARILTDGPGAFTARDLTATSAFRPTAQDGVVPFFDRRIVFPYWSRGHVVFMIGRRTPWTPEFEWEKSKYKKLAIRNDRNNSHVAACIRNDVLYNEDVFLGRPERVVITEGVTDCISLMEHGLPAVSPVTVQIREADWERLLPKLAGVKTVFICQDNEVSEAGWKGALRSAHQLSLASHHARVAQLPLDDAQQEARRQLRERFGLRPGEGRAALESRLSQATPQERTAAQLLLEQAKQDVCGYFVAGHSAEEFARVLHPEVFDGSAVPARTP